MTLAKEVDHEKDISKVKETTYVLMDLVNLRMYVAMVTLFFDLVCSRVSFSDT